MNNKLVFIFFIVFYPFVVCSAELRSEWSEFVPFSFQKDGVVQGIDIDISNYLMKAIGNTIVFTNKNWNDALDDIKSGQTDFLTSATYTEDRAEFAYFSSPYRLEADFLVLSKHPRIILNFKTAAGFVEELSKLNFKIGIVEGYVYAENVVADYVEKNCTMKASYSNELVQGIYDNKLDGFITDSNEARKLVKNSGDKLAYIDTGMKTQLRFMFSKKTVQKDQVDKFNQALSQFISSNLYSKIVQKYSN